jgi:cytochrome b6-f complex iron-sulfur subunit
MDPSAVGVTRRQFFNRSLVGLGGLGVTGLGGAVLAFLWPHSSVGFGSKIDLGRIGDVTTRVRDAHQPLYVKEGRFYLVERGGELLALYQRCTHLGCRVPFCASSGWFECGCHAAMFNVVGEHTAGPAPRGLDRFPIDIVQGTVRVNTGNLLTGPPVGTETPGNEPIGPHCVGRA